MSDGQLIQLDLMTFDTTRDAISRGNGPGVSCGSYITVLVDLFRAYHQPRSLWKVPDSRLQTTLQRVIRGVPHYVSSHVAAAINLAGEWTTHDGSPGPPVV